MPSNVPWATTLGGASGRYWSRLRTICMDEAEWTEPPGRELADSEKGPGGVHAARRRDVGSVDGPELVERHRLTVGQPPAGLGGQLHGRQVRDGAVRRADARGQDGGVAPLERGPRHGVLKPEGPDARPHERFDVGAAPERLADVGGQAANVGAGAAGHAHLETGQRALDELERVDADPAGGTL